MRVVKQIQFNEEELEELQRLRVTFECIRRFFKESHVRAVTFAQLGNNWSPRKHLEGWDDGIVAMEKVLSGKNITLPDLENANIEIEKASQRIFKSPPDDLRGEAFVMSEFLLERFQSFLKQATEA